MMPWAVACGQQLGVGTTRSHLLNVCACAAKQRSPLTSRSSRPHLQSRLLVWSKGGGLTTVGCSPGSHPETQTPEQKIPFGVLGLDAPLLWRGPGFSGFLVSNTVKNHTQTMFSTQTNFSVTCTQCRSE